MYFYLCLILNIYVHEYVKYSMYRMYCVSGDKCMCVCMHKFECNIDYLNSLLLYSMNKYMLW